ncbi:MAG: extracellular solute-binding protein [bacterium]
MATINMWIWGGGTAGKHLVREEVRAFQKDCSGIFQKDHPGIDVEITLIPWQNAWESIMSAANERKGPDILQVGSTWNATLADLGVLKDITQEVENYGVRRDNFVPACWSSCLFPGSDRVTSLPWFADIRAMYYRKDIFQKLDLSADNLDNWNSFDQLCKTLKEYKKGNERLGVLGVSGQKESLLIHNIAPWIWGAGGDFLTPDGHKAAFNHGEALNGIYFYLNLVCEGYIPHAALKLDSFEVARSFFNKGEYCMAIPGPASGFLDTSHPEYNALLGESCASALFPKGEAGRFIFCGGSNLGITSFAEHPKEAWEFIRFLTSYDSQSRYPKILNMFPSLAESFDSVFSDETTIWKGFENAWKYGRAFPNVPAWGAIESLLIECFARIFARIQEKNYNLDLGREDLDKAAGEVDDLLAR